MFVTGVRGPLATASGTAGVAMFEFVHVGATKMPGEITAVGNTATILMLGVGTVSAGDAVYPTGRPRCVELGPGFMGGGPLDPDRAWDFLSTATVGDTLAGGDVIGTVPECAFVVTVPPLSKGGRVTYAAGHGTYKPRDTIVSLDSGEHLTMLQRWPIRQPRPVARTLDATQQLVTGQRVLDSLFPLALGGTCTMSSVYGCGMGLILHSIVKHSNCDAVVYIGCGERSYDVAEIIQEYSQMTPSRIVLLAATPDTCVATREATVDTGMAIAECLRDMGKHIVVVAASTTRWSEALREISPGRDVGVRIAEFYGRAGRVQCLGNPMREGSVTIVATASPSDRDGFSKSGVVWDLDIRLAQQKHFPSVRWLTSTSTDPLVGVLRQENALVEKVEKVGTESLCERDKVTLAVARLIREEFLQQNSFTEHDKYCPMTKTVWMSRILVGFYEGACCAVEEDKVHAARRGRDVATWSTLRDAMSGIIKRLCEMKYADTESGYFQKLNGDMVAELQVLTD